MRIIPVIDLMGSQVVQAVRGERSSYRPVQSILVPDAKPLSVARALQKETDCNQLYIADLDAIMGRGNQRDVVQELARGIEAQLWIDAAINDVASAEEMLKAGADRVIVCSETLLDWDVVRAIGDVLPADRLLFSIDIVDGRVCSLCPILHRRDPLIALDLLSREGWREFILLSISQVGTGEGPDWQLLSTASRYFPQLSIIAGGGVCIPRDLERLAELHISGVLLATSLHRGWITREDLLKLDSRF